MKTKIVYLSMRSQLLESTRNQPFHNKVAIVTGGSEGIGFSIGEALAQQGASVFLFSRSREKLHQAIARIQSFGGIADGVALDVSNPHDIKAAVERISRKAGKIDLFISNAGIGLIAEVHNMTLTQWDRVIAVNLSGAFYGIHAVYPLMMQQGFGRIVIVSSGTGFHPEPFSAAYAASKYALIGLADTLRLEASLHNIGITVVCPPLTDTPILRNFECVGFDREKLLAAVPFSAMSPGRVAEIVLKGITRNKRMIIVGFYEKALYSLMRYSPSLVMKFMQYYTKVFARDAR